MSVRIAELVQVLITYMIFVFSTGMLIDRRFLRGRGFTFRFITDFVVGNFYIINMTFVLAYINLLIPGIMALAYYSVAILIYYLTNRKRLKVFWQEKRVKYQRLITGEYGWKVALRQTRINIANVLKSFADRYVSAIALIEFIGLVIVLGIFAYYYTYHALHIVSYGAPDEEVHLYWVQSLIAGKLFPVGVYPFGMHCLEAAMCMIFQIPAVNVARNLGPVVGVMVMFMMYLLLKKLSNIRFAPLLSILLFAIADIVVYSTYNRFYSTIPQEYAMMFLVPVIYYVFRYLKDKHIYDLVFLGMSFSLTLAVHFYVSIICAYFFIGVGLVYLIRIIKRRMLLPLLVCGILSILVALAPLGIGLLMGFELEQSFKYGAAVAGNDMSNYSTEDEVLRKEADEVESEFEKQVWIVSGEYGNLVPAPYLEHKDYILLFSRQYFETYIFEHIKYILIFIIAVVLIVLNWFFRLISRHLNEQSLQWLSLAIFIIVMFFTIWVTIFGYPTLLELKRMGIFVAYMIPFALMVPLEIVGDIIGHGKVRNIILNLAIIALGASCCFYVKENDLVKDLAPFYYFQTTGAMKSVISIEKNYEPYTWTLVSVVNENSIVLNHGNHYEWIDLLLPLENYKKDKRLYIPSQYVFFLVEKRPIVDYGVAFEKGSDQIVNRPKFKEKDAKSRFETRYASKDTYYKEDREKVMARAYYYMQALQKNFPDECSVYYEDDQVVMYRLEQNTYALDNLAIDYRKDL